MVSIVGVFDWFRKKKPASEQLSLNSIEFPWPKDKGRTNYPRGANHWMNNRCDGSKQQATNVTVNVGKLFIEPKTGHMRQYTRYYGTCSSCGKQGEVTSTYRAFCHLPVSSVS